MNTQSNGKISPFSLGVIVTVDGNEIPMRWPRGARRLATKDEIGLPRRIDVKPYHPPRSIELTDVVITEPGREVQGAVSEIVLKRFLSELYGRVAPYFAYRRFHASILQE